MINFPARSFFYFFYCAKWKIAPQATELCSVKELASPGILPTHFVTIKKHKLPAPMFFAVFFIMFNATYFLCTIHKDQARFMWFCVTNYSLLHDWALEAVAAVVGWICEINLFAFVFFLLSRVFFMSPVIVTMIDVYCHGVELFVLWGASIIRFLNGWNVFRFFFPPWCKGFPETRDICRKSLLSSWEKNERLTSVIKIEKENKCERRPAKFFIFQQKCIKIQFAPSIKRLWSRWVNFFGDESINKHFLCYILH